MIFSNLCFASENLDVVFTKPNCTIKEYQYPVKNLNNFEFHNSKQGVFCSSSDFGKSFDILNTSIGLKLKNILSNNTDDPIKFIKFSYYIFSDKTIANLICSGYKVNKFKVLIYTQSDSKTGGQSEALNILNQCIGNDLTLNRIGCNVFVDTCDKNKINIMHMKLIEVTRNSNRIFQVFGSGNIGKGIYANLEDWLFLTQDGQSIHSCTWNILKDYKENFDSLKNKYSLCEKGKNKNIELLFLPFDSKKYYKKFLNLSKLANEISIISSDFNDKKLNTYLEKFIKKGGVINFYTNSDVYYSALYKDKKGYAEPKDITLMLHLKKSNPSQVKIYFVDTNFYYSTLRNTLHHKLVIFLNKNHTENYVMTGSANLNFTALNRQYEQVYLLHNNLVENYINYLDFLKKISIEYDEMPLKIPKIKESL